MIILSNYFRVQAIHCVFFIFLGGCATHSLHNSYIDQKISYGQAAIIALSITEFVERQLPAANSIILLEPVHRKTKDLLAPILTDHLYKAGFAVATLENGIKDSHRLRYLVTPFEHGILIRMYLDTDEASQWFSIDEKGKLEASEVTIREAADEIMVPKK